MRNFSESPSLSIASFPKVQREVTIPLMSLEKMKSRRELSKHCSMHGKSVKFLVRIISEHP